MSTRDLKSIEHLFFYKDLLKKHKLSDYGTWRIRGEDANCDLGGSHHMPEIGIVEGILEEVLLAAINMPRFWTWGGGGDITPVKVVSMASIRRQEKLKEEKAELLERIAEIDQELL